MGGDFGLRVPLTPDSPARSPVYDVDLFHSCYRFAQAPLDGVKAVRVDIARLARNYGLADEKREVRQYPARTRFGELVVYQDRCEAGIELARVPLPDPATSSNVQTLQPPLARVDGARDLCLLFTASIDGPIYAIERVRLLTQ
jgi:hexosaminidase